jgi:mercuric ion binding protein
MKKLTIPGLMTLATLFAIPVFLTLSASPAAAQAPATATVDPPPPGMHCATCPITVRTVLRRLDGVSDAVVSTESKTARVTYDPARVTPARMAQAVTDAGYPARVQP